MDKTEKKPEDSKKSPFNFPPKQTSVKKPANPKVKSYTFLENEDHPQPNPQTLTHTPKNPIAYKSVLGGTRISPYKTTTNSSEEYGNIEFITRKEYKDKHFCNICCKDFPNLISQIKKKHCKVCGNAVCGDCASQRIKDKRTCDVCVYKINNKQEEELKEEYLINYEESIKEMEIELQNMENKIDELKNLTLVINTQTENEKNQSKRTLNDLDKKIIESKNLEKEKKQLYEKLLEQFNNLTDELKHAKIDYQTKEQDFKSRKMDMERKKILLEEKNKEFKKLQEELNKL